MYFIVLSYISPLSISVTSAVTSSPAKANLSIQVDVYSDSTIPQFSKLSPKVSCLILSADTSSVRTINCNEHKS